MRKLIAPVIVLMVFAVGVCIKTYANDPNNYTQPATRSIADTPPPEYEDVYKLNNKTVRVTWSEDMTLKELTARRRILDDQIERNIKRNIDYQAEITVIDRRLEVLK